MTKVEWLTSTGAKFLSRGWAPDSIEGVLVIDFAIAFSWVPR